jgi:hypothetical protein
MPQFTIHAFLVQYIHPNDHGKGNADGKAQYVDGRKQLVFCKMAKSNKDIISKHNASCIYKECKPVLDLKSYARLGTHYQ